MQGLSGGSNSGNALFSVRGKANMFTKITAFLAVGFFCTSLALAYMASHKAGHSIVDQITTTERVLPIFTKKDVPAKNSAPVAKPIGPEVPLAK